MQDKTSSNALLRRGLRVEYASLTWMTVEAAGAIFAGVLSGSLALFAFGGDSIVELLSSFAVVAHLRTENENEGSERKTKRTEIATVLLLILLIPIIGLAAAYAYFTGAKPESSLVGIVIAAGAVIIMPTLWFEKRRIGREAKCLPLTVDSSESATCFLMSAALLAALLANYLWGLWWIDYGATAVILLLLAREVGESVNQMRAERQKAMF
jgi:divalent metal cation (Fe/Co/Zn/Cd) transporter